MALLVASAAQAQEAPAPLPSYDTCLARAVAHFEMELRRAQDGMPDNPYEIVGRDRVDYCATLAIVACDRADDPLACQADLARAQRALWQQVLDAVPAPDAVAGLDGGWSDALYPRLLAVARGSSAGPDCAGADAAYAAWCETRQAGLKLGEAVMAWQVARILGAADPAAEAGWLDNAMPFEPVMRPGR